MNTATTEQAAPWETAAMQFPPPKYDPSRYCWPLLDQEQAALLWREVADWTTWFRNRYNDTRPVRKIPDCWYCHPGLVEELTALMAAWQGAYQANRDPETHVELVGTAELTAWHTQWLSPFLHRLDVGDVASTQECNAKQCGYVGRGVDTIPGLEEFIADDVSCRPAPKPKPAVAPSADSSAARGAGRGSGGTKPQRQAAHGDDGPIPDEVMARMKETGEAGPAGRGCLAFRGTFWRRGDDGNWHRSPDRGRSDRDD